MEYLNSHWSPYAVNIHILNLCAAVPIAMPSPILWNLPKGLDIASIVHSYMIQRETIENIWPSLKLIMGQNVLNFAWSAGAFTTLAFSMVIHNLPHLLAVQANTEPTGEGK